MVNDASQGGGIMGTEHHKLVRRTRQKSERQLGLLGDHEPDWADYWWGMPSFSMDDCRPLRRVTVNFATRDDFRAFQAAIGFAVSDRADSIWYPKQHTLSGEYYWDGPKVTTRYPVYVPSKGRADCQRTGRVLDRMGVNYRFVVEQTEAAEYRRHLGAARVLVLPFHDLGQGSIPARNWIWEHAVAEGHQRHWVMDDNLNAFARCTNNRRLRVYSGAILRAIEDFADRYENLAMVGPHHLGFVPDRSPDLTPVLFNTRVYSCILIDTKLPHRWRGRYNEDTDLSLRVLKDGYCTAVFRALLMDKGATQKMKGGNTDHVYNTGDHRLEFAESLQRQHPDCVKVSWKFDRWHHVVDYSPFRGNKPILRAGVTPVAQDNDYGLELVYAPRVLDREHEV